MILRIAALLLALFAPALAHAEWHEASSAHFVVYADDKPEAIVRFAEELERFHKVMRIAYPNARPPAEGPSNRVTVFVISRSAEMEKLTGDEFTRGFYIPRAGGNVAFVPRVSGKTGTYELSGAMVLRHEYAHHFMFSSLPAIFPIWFSEGFAEFWSTVRFEKDGAALIGVSPAHRGWGLHAGNPLPIDQLLASGNRKLSDAQREAIYGRGWLLTHYMMMDPARQRLLGQYMNALNRGEPPEKAAAIFGDLKLLGGELDKYLRRPRLPASRVTAEAIGTPSVKLRKLTAGEVATMDIRILSRRGVDTKEAAALVMRARKAAAPFPDDPGAQVALAQAEYDAGNYALADAAASRAIAADPTMTDALLHRAIARFALAEAEATAGKKPDWAAVRQAIDAANRTDPEDPRSLILGYRSYFAAREMPTAGAKAGFLRAYRNAPSDLGLRMNIAAMFLGDGRRVEAREALRIVAYHPHGGGASDHARAMLAALDGGAPTGQVLSARPAAAPAGKE